MPKKQSPNEATPAQAITEAATQVMAEAVDDAIMTTPAVQDHVVEYDRPVRPVGFTPVLQRDKGVKRAPVVSKLKNGTIKTDF